MDAKARLSDGAALDPGVSAVASLEAVLIDMDGTAADTEPHWFAAEAKYASQYGKPWGTEDAHKLVGTPIRTTTTALRERTDSGHSHEEILAFLIEQMVGAISTGEANPRPGILELLAQLKEAGIPVALVTSSHAPLAEAFVRTLPPGTFAAVISADDVKNLKPHPEPYLRAAAQLGVDPSLCVALEDSPSGVASAVASGAKVIGIPCVVDVPRAENLSRVGSAEELTIPLLRRIVEGEVVDTLGHPSGGGSH